MDVAEFLDRYRQACAEQGVEPLPPAELANLAAELLGLNLTLH